ncbi:MAG: DUF1588 domain-containing protein [Planctomycetota bacterium]|nr:DUF1588 domain-containing protein [Planctomycetota bacterium]
MMRLVCVVAWVVALGVVTAVDASESDKVARSATATEVVAFLKTHCVACHATGEPQAGLVLDRLTIDFSRPAQIDLWQRILEQLVLGAMPPAGEPVPASAKLKGVTQWIVQQLRGIQQRPLVEQKLRSPEFGNRVNHQKLFDGSQLGPSASPSRLWRLSPYVYDRFVDGLGRELRRQTAIHQPYPLDAGKGVLADFAAQQFADAATLQLLMMNCQTIAQYQTTGVVYRDHEDQVRRLRQTPPEFEAILTADSLPTRAQIQSAIALEYQVLLERPPSGAEMERLVDFCQGAIRTGGAVLGLQTTLQAIMMQPEAVYRLEIGLGPKDGYGRRRLSGHELAFALARALTDLGPSDIRVRLPLEGANQSASPGKRADGSSADGARASQSLLQLCLSGQLFDPQTLRRTVRQILDDNNMSTADYRMFTEDHHVRNKRVLRFFQEFFGYHHAPKVFKDSKRIGHGDRYLTQRMVDDADQLVMHIFDEDRDVLRRLLTTEAYFVAYLGSRAHIAKDLHYIKTNKNDANFRFNTQYLRRAEAAGRHPIPIEGPDARQYVGFYNLDHETWDYPTQQPFAMPAKQRAGILMHPAWLIAWSGNFENDPIRRGKWIREHLLAGSLPDVPLDVNAVVPDNPHQTLRQRLQVTRDAYCWKCHRQMDPLGLPFEQFDDFGRYRQRELVGSLLTIFPERHTEATTRPIDVTGAVVASGDVTLNGEVADAFELVHKLADSPRVRQSFVRHAFRFWMGRNETLDDSPVLMAADEAYVRKGGSMKALIASLLSSDAFLYRKQQ